MNPSDFFFAAACLFAAALLWLNRNSGRRVTDWDWDDRIVPNSKAYLDATGGDSSQGVEL